MATVLTKCMRLFDSKLLRPLVLAIAVSTALPSASIAFDSDDEPDQIVTMTVDLPATDGSGGGGGTCTGYSSLETSASNLQATLDEVDPGNQDPSLEERIGFYGFDLDEVFTDSGGTEYAIFVEGDGSYLEINSTWSAIAANAGIVAALDTNDNGRVDSDDDSPLMLDSRVFASSPFTVTFDASTCVSSERFGVVWAERSDVETLVEDLDEGELNWESAEFYSDDEDDPFQGLLDGPGNKATAYLLRPTRIADGLVNAPLQLANFQGYGIPIPVVAGDEGSASLQGVMQMHGNQAEGQYRVKYGFWLEIDTFDFFDEEFPFWFGGP